MYKFIGVEGRPIHPSLLPLLQETVDLLRTMPSLADDWGEGPLSFDDETDTDSDDQVAPDAMRLRDGNTGVRVKVSAELQRYSLGLTDPLPEGAALDGKDEIGVDIKFAPKVALILGGVHSSTNEWDGDSSASDDEAKNDGSARSMLDVARPCDGNVSKTVSAGTGMLLE